jgi:ribose transport system permease protein
MVISNEKSKLKFIRRDTMQQFLAFTSLIILFLVFTFASPNFLQFTNIIAIILSTCVIGLLAIGVTFIIITGGIDLSLGTSMTLSSVMAGIFITNWHLPLPFGILGGIMTGALIGFLNGTAIAKLKLPPFITTLGTMMITRGLALVISGATPIYFIDTPSFAELSMGSVISKMFGGLQIPNAVPIFFILAIIASLILSKTVLGRYNFSIGSNEEATRLSGVNVDRWKIAIYTLSGVFVGIAGILMAARLNSAQPALGQGYELDAIAGVVIGGTSLSGGEGTILGTIIGSFLMSVLINGLRILSVPQEWQMVATGAIVIIAVYLDLTRRKKG